MTKRAFSQATPASDESTVLQQAARAAWLATQDERRDRYHSGRRCPTRHSPYGVDDPYGTGIDAACEAVGCIDLIHEVIARVLTKLDTHKATLNNRAAFCYTIACHELVETKRAARTGSGFPARPSRSDGAAGRVDRALMATADGKGTWLITIFRILRSYPYSALHVPGQWPVDGLTRERELALPNQTSSPEIVRAEIAQVLTITQAVAGPKWVYANLTMPIQAHGVPQELPATLAAPQDDLVTVALSGQLKQAYLRLRREGLSQLDALTGAASKVTGLAAPRLNAEVTMALEALDAELLSAA